MVGKTNSDMDEFELRCLTTTNLEEKCRLVVDNLTGDSCFQNTSVIDHITWLGFW